MADNSKYLQESWSKRTLSAREKVLESIDALKTAKEPINFNSVSKKSGVSKHFLYGNAEIKTLIESQRSEENARSGAWHKKYDRTSRSKDVIIESKDKYIAKLEAENERLRKEINQLRAMVYEKK